MRIFYSTGMVSTKYGGIERMLVRLASRLGNMGHKLIVQYEEDPLSREYVDDIMKVNGRFVRIRTNGREIKAFFEIYGFLRQEKIDIVHTNFSPAKHICVLAGRIAGCKKVISHHRNMGSGTPKTGLKLWFVSRFSDINIAISDAVKRDLIKAGAPEAKISVMYNGVDVPELGKKEDVVRGLGIAVSQPVLMTVAWDGPVKGVDLLLKALAGIKDEIRGVSIWIAGSAANSGDNKNLAKNLGIDGDIVWLGERDDIPYLLNACDIYVQPSRSEALSLSILEAMAHEKPVVAFSVGGIPEVIIDGVTGFLAKAESPGALAEAILKILKDRALGETMGRKGKETVIKKFTLDSEIEGILACYGL